MKYIRTKDKIYKTKRKCIEKDCLVIGVKENGEIGLVRKDIIKQADTIEELCDRFVAIHKTIIDIDCITKSLQGMLKEGFSVDTWNIYGAIWTDEGLIYVAKMNEKGKMELL